MKVLISGTRKAPAKYAQIAIEASPWANLITQLIEGEGGNIDKAGRAWAEEHLIAVDPNPAPWQCFDHKIMPVVVAHINGKPYNAAAGPWRNEQMVTKAQAAIFVWNNQSKGTWDCMKAAWDSKLPMYVYEYLKNSGRMADDAFMEYYRRILR